MNIRKALESVRWADEIMVVDAFSTDNTVAIAKEYTDCIFQRPYEGPADQKNWAIPKATHEWVLLLDADEIVTPALRIEIEDLLKNGLSADAYWIKRINYFMEKRIRFGSWRRDKVIRLIRRDVCRYETKQVHEEIVTSGTVSKLKNKLEHHTYKNLSTHLQKLDRYSSWGALDKIKTTRQITIFHLFFKPLFRFIRDYILKLGFLDGKRGFIIAIFDAYHVFLRAVKIWRMDETK